MVNLKNHKGKLQTVRFIVLSVSVNIAIIKLDIALLVAAWATDVMIRANINLNKGNQQ